MAVIIADMNMPGGCWRCNFMRAKDPETDYCVLTGNEFDDRLDLLTTKQKDCPLKSTDEMIAEIELQVFTDAYDGQFVGIEDVKQVINKYCKGDTNGT